MKYSEFKARADKFFGTAQPLDIVKSFEQMGYSFTNEVGVSSSANCFEWLEVENLLMDLYSDNPPIGVNEEFDVSTSKTKAGKKPAFVFDDKFLSSSSTKQLWQYN